MAIISAPSRGGRSAAGAPGGLSSRSPRRSVKRSGIAVTTTSTRVAWTRLSTRTEPPASSP